MANDNDNGSIFKTALIGAPVIVGAAYTIKDFENPLGYFNQPVQTPVSPATNTIREIVSKYTSPDNSTLFKDWQIKELEKLASDTPLSSNQIRTAVARAARVADPAGTASLLFGERLASATTGPEAVKSLLNILRESSSIYVQRTASLFMDDLRILNQRVEAGLSIETSTLASKVPRINEGVAVSALKEAGLEPNIERIRAALGEETTVDIRKIARKDMPGSELHLTFADSPLFEGKLTAKIPRVLPENPALIVHGATQQSKYIAGMYGIIEDGILKQSFNHEQWVAHRIETELIPEIIKAKKEHVLTQRYINNLIAKFEKDLLEPPEWVPTYQPGEHKGVDEYIKHRSKIMRLYTLEEGKYRPINEFEHYRLIEQGGAKLPAGGVKEMFPAASPTQISKGVVATEDIRQSLYFTPEAAPFGRRPISAIRKEVEPLFPEDIAKDPITKRFAWAKAQVGVDTPMVRTAFISPKYEGKLSDVGITQEGQGLISERLSRIRAVKEWKQYKVASNELIDLERILGKGTGGVWSINRKLEESAFLGYDPEGKPVTVPKGTEILGAYAFEKDKEQGDFVRVMTKQDITDLSYSKTKHGMKGMLAQVTDPYLANIFRKDLNIPSMGSIVAPEVEAAVSMADLKKNRALHYNQMFTSLWDFTKRNMASGQVSSIMATNFANDPNKMIERMNRIASGTDTFNHQKMLNQIMYLARGAELTPGQMGRVFGAVPDIFGDINVLGTLSKLETEEIQKGVATGVTQFFYESPGAAGAGKMATIEPRMFELLNAPHFGALGPKLQAEVADRMLAQYPERVIEQQQLSEALESISAAKKRTGAISLNQFFNEIGDDILPQQATSVRLGDFGDIYVPGAEQVRKLAAYKTAEGQVVDTRLAHAYENLFETARAYEDKEIARPVMQAEIGKLEKELIRAKVATVTGQGGLLRNRLPGSMFLTAVKPTLRNPLPENVIGITGSYAEQMFESMRQTGLYEGQEAALETMERTFMSGARVSGIIGRHPYIGPYSTQAADFMFVKGNAPIAMINERAHQAFVAKGKVEGEALARLESNVERAFLGSSKAQKELSRVQGEMLNSPIRLSPLVGLAGDVDGDMVSAMFAGPQLQKSLSSHISSQNAMDMYSEYSIRSQVLKAKAGAGDVTLRKAMAGDVTKLSITESGRLGRLSVGLQQYRAAVLSGAGNITGQQRGQALGLLEWMEQTPISGKHIKTGEELSMINLLDRIQSSLDKKSAAGMASATREIMTETTLAGEEALNKGFTAVLTRPDTGELSSQFVSAIHAEDAAKNIINARRAFEQTQMGQAAASQIRQLIMNRGGLSTGREAARVLNDPDMLAMSPFGAFFQASEKSTASQLATRASTVLNKLGAAGKSMIPLARPVGLGLAASLGIAAILSEPPKVLPPGSGTAPLADLKSGTGGAHLGYGEHPEPHTRSEPTTQNPVNTSPSVRLAQQETPGYRIDIRGRTGQSTNMNDLNAQIRQAVGNNTRVNSHIRDQRSSLTPQKLASILNE